MECHRNLVKIFSVNARKVSDKLYAQHIVLKNVNSGNYYDQKFCVHGCGIY